MLQISKNIPTTRKAPAKPTIQQQIKQHLSKKKANALLEIVGQWPSNESFETILEQLN